MRAQLPSCILQVPRVEHLPCPISGQIQSTVCADMHRDALMYVQAVGWQLARKDKIDLDSETLHQKQGVYTCPPTAEGQKPFHCCLQMREEPINVGTP